MASLTMYPDDEKLSGGARIVFDLYVVTAVLAFLAFMGLGLTMRMAEAQWLYVQADVFYQILSMHGTGMVGIAALVTTAVMWYFLRKYVVLHLWAFVANYVLFVVGAVLIVLSIFVGGYGALWTFLYPLPARGMQLWSSGASILYILGYILIGLGSLLFYLDATAAVLKRYGNLRRAMGWNWLFGGQIDPDHPKAVIASVGVIIANGLGIIAGEVALFMTLVTLIYPDIILNALIAKNLIYWFGHMYANATIYMGVIAVYELLPRYTGKPYAISRPFLWAWLVTCLYVIVVFPHHLFMDYAQPHWVAVMGQIASWVGGFPVFVITVYGALVNLYRSNIRWTMPSMLLILSMFGWAAGVVPAILDGTVQVNQVMHNTQWVPGHFHFYMLLGVLPMALALMFHEIGRRRAASPNSVGDRIALPLFLVGGLVFVFGFLYGGHVSVARRMAQHWSGWLFSDAIGSIGAVLVVLAMLYFFVRVTSGLLRGAEGR